MQQEKASETIYNAGLDHWQHAIHTTVKCVVSVHFSNVTPFDTEQTYVSQASGFVVDAKNGIIMTNRHVLGPGPFYGYVVFDNHEECPVTVLYRDPVHDFGFLKFDPKAIKHMKVDELVLRPENARVGVEIRVIGNDAGEKLSILAGVISRVDRNAPEYGATEYNDFNTEYIQAAASASGGSSGSPVVDVHGNVVALQAGGSSVASTDFFLPLFRGKRALECLQQGKKVQRGTIQVRWLLHPFETCRRLGLTAEAEQQARLRDPKAIGMLVASTPLPGGPADGLIQEGDCLLAVNGEPLSSFSCLDAVLDENVGKTVGFTLMRGGEVLKPEITVQNLFSITPDRFVRISGAVMHELSYQIASSFCHSVKGVYIAFSGFYLCPNQSEEYSGWVLTELDGHSTPDLDTFIEVVRKIPDGSVSATFWHVADPHNVVTSIVHLNRHWSRLQDFELCVKNEETGLWDFTSLGPSAQAPKPKKQTARFTRLLPAGVDPRVSKLNQSIVRVSMLRPGRLDGFTPPAMRSHGFVINKEKGLVLVSRLCVPHFLVDLQVVVAESVILPAVVRFLHPQQGYAIIQYDSDLVEADIIEIPFPEPEPEARPAKKAKTGTQSDPQAIFKDENRGRLALGDELTCIGYGLKGGTYIVPTRVADVSPSSIPTGFGIPPRFRATNIDCVGVDSSLVLDLDTALLVDANTNVRALWLDFLGDFNQTTRRDRTYRFALDTSDISETVRGLCDSLPSRPALPATNTLDLRFVDVEALTLTLAHARIHHVPEKWIERVEQVSPKPEFLYVSQSASSAADFLEEGDAIVSVNGKLATRASQLVDLPADERTARFIVIRRGLELEIDVPTVAASETVSADIIGWCGMTVQKVHHAVLQYIKRPPSQVYIVGTHSASPAAMYDIYATCFITHVNGASTPDLGSFYKACKAVPDNTYVIIRTVNFEGGPAAQSVRTNYHYFPTWRITLDKQTGKWSSI